MYQDLVISRYLILSSGDSTSGDNSSEVSSSGDSFLGDFVHKIWIDKLFILLILWVLPLQRLRLAFIVFSSSKVFLALTDLPHFKHVMNPFTVISIICPSRTSICVGVLQLEFMISHISYCQ